MIKKLLLTFLITPSLYPSASASAAASAAAQPPTVNSVSADQKSAAADVKTNAAAHTIHNAAQENLPTTDLSSGSVARGHRALKAEDFVWLQKVQGINLSGQNLKEFPIGILQHCPSVRAIDLSNNQIASLPEGFEELWLESNRNLCIILTGNPLPEYTKGYLRRLQKTKGATMCPSEHPGIDVGCYRMFVFDVVRATQGPPD